MYPFRLASLVWCYICEVHPRRKGLRFTSLPDDMSLNNRTPIPTFAALSDCRGGPLWGYHDQASPVLVQALGARERVFL